MKYDTAGNLIREPIQNCRCGLTGGCRLCNPFYGAEKLDKQLEDNARNAPGIEEILKITDKMPQKVWDEAIGRKRFCKNCGEELDEFCSRYCRVEYEIPQPSKNK